MEEPEKVIDELAAKRRQFWHAWRRRGFVAVAFLLILVPLYGTFRPLFEFLLFAVSLAALTYPVLFRPVEKFGCRLAPSASPQRRSEVCAVAATGLLLLLFLLPFAVVIFGGSDSAEDLGGAVLALLVGDTAGREALLDGVAETVREVQAIYPRLPVDEERAVAFAAEFLGDASEFSGSILDYLFKGTRGFVAELALALIALSFLYAHGPTFVRKAMATGGFASAETTAWMRLHRAITFRLLSDTVLTALARGLCLGLVAWLVGGFFFLPVFLLGAFAGLVPVVGSAMVWLPLASLTWTRGEPTMAIALAVVSIVLNFGVSQARSCMGRKLHEQGAWMSFLLFLGIIGGILSYGAQGFVIGPMAVVLAYGLVRFLTSPIAEEKDGVGDGDTQSAS